MIAYCMRKRETVIRGGGEDKGQRVTGPFLCAEGEAK